MFMHLIMLILFLIPGLAMPQNTDSIWAVWNDQSLADTSRLNAINELQWKSTLDSAYTLSRSMCLMDVNEVTAAPLATLHQTVGVTLSYHGDFDQSNQLLDRGLEIADKHNLIVETADLYHSKGFVLKKEGKYNLAKEAYEYSLSLREQLGLKDKISDSYNSIGVFYIQQQNVAAALDYFQKGVKISEEINDTKRMARGYQNIGLIYLDQKNLTKALEYLLNSLEIYEATNAKRQISYSYNNIGVIYKDLGQLDKALEYYNKGLLISEESGDRNNMSYLYINIGNIHRLKGEFQLAKDAFKVSLKMSAELGNYRRQVGSLNGLGTVYNRLDQHKLAISNCEKAYALAKEIEYLEELKNSCNCLMNAYENLKEYERALTYAHEFYVYEDSIRKLERAQEVTRIGMTYEFDKQRLADSLAMEEEKLKAELAYNKKLTEEKVKRNSFMYVGLCILLFAGALFSRLLYVRRTNRTLHEKNILIDRERRRAEESERSKEEFFSNVSHEFRTPLTLILGPLDKIITETKDEKLKEDLCVMKRNATRLRSMINELLNLYKLESGKITLRSAEDDIVSFLTAYVQSFESLAKQKQVKLSVKSEFKTYPLYFDKEKIEKIITNLLSNAFKFTDEGGEIVVSISNRQSAVGSQQSTVIIESTEDWRLETEDSLKKGVIIKVADNGTGIPKDKTAHVFDRFFQVDKSLSRNHEGTGIGLALTKELVELHRGRIWVESEEGIGTTFSFYMPAGKDHLLPVEIIEEDLVDDKKEDSEMTLILTDHDDEDEKSLPIILIVEDNTDMRNYIKGYLDQTYKIIEADNGEEGLNKAIENIPDLILSDVMMPKMDGTELCKRLKCDERTSHIPVVMLTARASVEEKIEGLETGADAYIAKPFNAKELQVRIKKLIEQRKKLRERFVKNLGTGIKFTNEDITTMDQQFFKKLMEVIEKHIADSDFTVDIFSREMALSRVQLHRKIKALTGQSSNRFLRTIRLKRAAELLSKGSMNVTEAAYNTGFNNMSYFAKCFHEQFGVAPSEYSEEV